MTHDSKEMVAKVGGWQAKRGAASWCCARHKQCASDAWACPLLVQRSHRSLFLSGEGMEATLGTPALPPRTGTAGLPPLVSLVPLQRQCTLSLQRPQEKKTHPSEPRPARRRAPRKQWRASCQRQVLSRRGPGGVTARETSGGKWGTGFRLFHPHFNACPRSKLAIVNHRKEERGKLPRP